MFLDKNIQLCTEDQAVFQVTRPPKEVGSPVLDEQRLEEYNSELVSKARELSRESKAVPVGCGDSKNWKMELEGFRFHWGETVWECEWNNHIIELHPNCDSNDAAAVLKELMAFRKGVFTRSRLANQPIEIKIGCTDPQAEKCVASAQVVTHRNREVGVIRLPFCENQSHLLPVKVADVLTTEGSKTPLRDLLLHELGHTVKRDFRNQWEELRTTNSTGWELLMPALAEMSPHYLEEQKGEILDGLRLKEVVSRLPELSLPERMEAETSLRENSKRIGSEIFAEMVRFYYLEPCITQNFPAQPETGNPTFDGFAKLLLHEATLNQTAKDVTYPEYRGPENLSHGII